MLIGYVSDEYYVALNNAALEFEQEGKSMAIVRSSPRGAVYADIPPGEYRVTLAKDGYGSKTVTTTIDPARPWQFRMLSDTLYGYVWPKWVRAGDKGELRVHSPEPYHVTLWRYGKKKEMVRAIGWFDEHGPRANVQVVPDGDFTLTGAEWNRRGFNPAVFQLIAPEQSGLYYFHAETLSGKFLSFPWVVAPRQATARVALLASTNTWNAYNNFGGRSNYINVEGLLPQPTINSRQDLGKYNGKLRSVWQFADEEYKAISFDRPEPFNHVPKGTEVADPIRGRQPCHLAEAEWRLMGWMEREGFAYDLYSDRQLHDGELELDKYDVLVISTHPEYWSRVHYERVKEWVFKRGGKLMYLGGNGIDCEVEYVGESAMRCLNWLPAGPGFPFVDSRTGQTIDNRLHRTMGSSPAELLGVVFTDPGAMTSAPYRVVDASHWIFAGLGLKNGDVFGTESLHERCPGGASGHETDKVSPSSPTGLSVLARGMNIDQGGAEIIYHETSGGGAVFSVGSITWTAAVLVDAGCSGITRNVLEYFLQMKN
ncbi:MAG TPA: N,N-dimethylformamidase beta subunit family domain-containing protein [Tepidisphaeraceae bacterium]|jgi:hypothetical protein|nr:N,N-dimethylformamidase beta subunit family domain-containing protein [Tepidisphaeraceae bacterium]